MEWLFTTVAGFATAFAFLGALVALKRGWRGERIVRRSDYLQFLDMLLNVGPFLIILPAVDLLAKAKLPWWQEFPFFILGGAALAWPIMAASRWLDALKQREFAATALNNPGVGAPEIASLAPRAALSFGEWLKLLKDAGPALLALAIILIITSVGMALLDLHQMWAWWVALGVTLGVPLYIVFGRYPGDIVKTAEIDIAAPPERVWRDVATYAVETHWHPMIVRIDRLPGTGEIYASRMRFLGSCQHCGFPKPPDFVEHSAMIEVLSRVDGVSEETRLTQGAGGFWFMRNMFGDMVTKKTLAPIPGGTRVSSTVRISRPKIYAAFGMLFFNTAGMALEELKAEVEGASTPDTISQRQRLEEIRRSPSFCNCQSSADS